MSALSACGRKYLLCVKKMCEYSHGSCIDICNTCEPMARKKKINGDELAKNEKSPMEGGRHFNDRSFG